MPEIIGSDLSEYQQVGSAPREGELFWFVRLRDGEHVDKSYVHHVSVALGHYLPYIAPYIFYRSYMDPVKQADYLAAAVLADARLMTGAVDIEEQSFETPDGSSDRLTIAERNARIDRFISRYEQRVRRRLILYTNPDTAARYVEYKNIAGSRRVILWQAEYGPTLSPIPYLPAPSFWQTADRGGAGGGDVDVCLRDRTFLESLKHPLVPVKSPEILGPWTEHPRTTRAGYRVIRSGKLYYEVRV